MLNKNLIILSNIVAVLAGGILSCAISKYNNPSPPVGSAAVATTTSGGGLCRYTMVRGNINTLVKPLLYAEQECESENYSGLKTDLQNAIHDFEKAHKITTASVYFRDLSCAAWIETNPGLTFSPGALGRLPLLFTYLHKAETTPELLNKYIYSGTRPADLIVNGSGLKNQITEKQDYTLKALLEAAIVNDDSYATYLLNREIDISLYKKTYSDLGLPVPRLNNENYEINTRDYSRFLLVTYNASYLSYAMSEYVSSLLRTHEFNRGLAAALPAEQKMIGLHEQWEDATIGVNQLHESAIIYLKNKPYLVTFMSEGVNRAYSLELLSKVSEIIYGYMQGKDKPAV